MVSNHRVTVYGAYGHTGRFVVSELYKRGWRVILSGRDESKLGGLSKMFPEPDVRAAAIDDSAGLDRALNGAEAMINCAGPFLDTADPLIEAALRSGIHYLDVTAEQPAVLGVYEKFADAAREKNIVVAPAVSFFGGLADLLASAAMGDWAEADDISIAVALDSWKPTFGTRATGKRNSGRRFVFSKGRLDYLPDPAPTRIWDFPAPFGKQDVVAVPMSEIITISSHLKVTDVNSYMNLIALTELRNPNRPGPAAADESGRSDQSFVMDVIARWGTRERRTTASGRDIYAITAPIVVEAAARILDGQITRTGVASSGEIFDATAFLRSIPDLSFASYAERPAKLRS